MSDGTLSPEALRELAEAMVAAYDHDTLRRLFLFRLRRRLDHYASPRDGLTTVIADVIEQAMVGQADGPWLDSLVTAVIDDRSGNPKVRRWAERHWLLPPAPDPRNLPAGSGWERTVRADVPAVDAEPWTRGLTAIFGQVCRIVLDGQLPQVLGTGFLIGPGLCLTCRHVLAPVLDGGRRAADLRFLFDHQIRGRELRASEPVIRRPSEDLLVAECPSSRFDDLAGTTGVPRPGDADVAVVRLAGGPDDDTRGWIARRNDEVPKAGAPLLIVQYPGEAPLKLAHGAALGLNANRTRFQHTVTTAGGSSGSPILNNALELVGVHLAGDPVREAGVPARFNVAVPVATLAAALAAKGFLLQ
jgi:hypothetical protein